MSYLGHLPRHLLAAQASMLATHPLAPSRAQARARASTPASRLVVPWQGVCPVCSVAVPITADYELKGHKVITYQDSANPQPITTHREQCIGSDAYVINHVILSVPRLAFLLVILNSLRQSHTARLLMQRTVIARDSLPDAFFPTDEQIEPWNDEVKGIIERAASPLHLPDLLSASGMRGERVPQGEHLALLHTLAEALKPAAPTDVLRTLRDLLKELESEALGAVHLWVNDHAVERYLERIEGHRDPKNASIEEQEAARAAIWRIVATASRQAPVPGDGALMLYSPLAPEVRLIVDGHAVVTVLTEGMRSGIDEQMARIARLLRTERAS